jgi:hypothetical protein
MQGLAYDLATRLPRTARALREGVIDAFKAQIIAEATRVLDDAGAAAAEALALPNVAGKNPGQIRAVIGRAVLKVDPDTARERRKQAEKDPRVELWREDAGTAALCGFHLPPDEALAADQMIAGQAEALKAAGLDGTMDQLRARAYLDILLGRDSRPAPEARDGTAGSADNPGSQAAGQDCQSDIGDVGDVGWLGRHGGANRSRHSQSARLAGPRSDNPPLASRLPDNPPSDSPRPALIPRPARLIHG